MPELVPPTVPVPLSALLADNGLALRQVAGPASPATPVHAVHTSEMADPVPYLLGGELLLSAGVHCPGSALDAAAAVHWEWYVERAVEAGAAALGFGIAPLHDEVPPALAPWTGIPRWPRPSACGCRCTAAGTAARWRSACTATPYGSG